MSGARIIWVSIDGIADVSVPSLGWKTPLQAARLPTLDRLAKHGLNGLLDPVEPGLACGSDTAHMSMLGYPPARHYRGRGAFESMGAGLEMQDGDVAFKCNFATLDRETGIVTSRRCDRQFHTWGLPLCADLTGIEIPGFPEVEVQVLHATEHRCAVRVRAPGLTDLVTGTDPLMDNRPLRRSVPEEDSPAAQRTAQIVNAVSEAFIEKLDTHPLNVKRREEGKPLANVVLLRGPAQRISVPSFYALHGLRACVIAPTAIIAGLCKNLGMDLIKAPGATGDYHTDLPSKARTLLEHFVGHKSRESDPSSPAAAPRHRYDLALLHVKAVDDAGHDKDASLKVHWLQQIDAMIAQILRGLEEAGERKVLFVVTGDHTTPVHLGDHSSEPVPVLVCPLWKVRMSLLPPSPPPVAAAAMTSSDGRSAKGNDSTAAAELSLTSSSSSSSAVPSTGESSLSPSGSNPLDMLLASDPVERFDELAAAAGVLGRFPGAEMMPLLKRIRQLL